MFNMDADKLAKAAKEKLQKAEKLGGSTGDVAKGILQGVKKAEELADLQGKVPEQMITVLRNLLNEAKTLAGVSGNKNKALDTCINKAQKLLESGDCSAESVAKLTAELGALIKGAGASERADGPKPAPDASPKEKPVASASVPSRSAKAAEPPAEKKTVRFSDVDTGAYYYDAVQWAVQQGIASGTTETTFSPDQTCTRAQTIALLWRAVGSPAPKKQSNPFTDVQEDAYYYHAVLWAVERGIASGTAFNPDAAVTRGQVATFLYRNAGSPAVENSGVFTDVSSDAYYYQAVLWVAAQGITSGTNAHTFNPDDACTRGQIVTFLYRSFK